VSDCDTMGADGPCVLFVCTGNAGRSQMAEAMFRELAGPAVRVMSAGVDPWDDLHPMARRVIAEIGLDFDGHRPKHVRDFADADVDLAVMIGDRAIAESPELPSGVRRIDWDIADPADADGTAESECVFRCTRKRIADRLPGVLSAAESMARVADVCWRPGIATAITRPEPFTPAVHLSMFVAAGFRTIELTCYNLPKDFAWERPGALGELRTVAADLGVSVWSVHPPDRYNLAAVDETERAAAVDEIRSFVDIASELGAAVVSFHAGHVLPKERPVEESVKHLHDSLDKLAEHTRGTPVTLGIETLPPGPHELSNQQIVEEARRGTQAAFGVVLDTGHANIARDLAGVPQMIGRRLMNLHLHDNDGERDQHDMPGTGTTDWRQVMADLRAADYRGPLMLEVADEDRDLETALQDASRSMGLLFEAAE
jgi:arsenate reductase (thioredoxin)